MRQLMPDSASTSRASWQVRRQRLMQKEARLAGAYPTLVMHRLHEGLFAYMASCRAATSYRGRLVYSRGSCAHKDEGL